MRSMDINTLKEIVSTLPQKPGVYFFKNKQEQTIYTGKASRLKNRLISYLKTKDTRIQKMVEEAKSLKFLIVDSEIEALILEAQYIKKLKPRFNIVMRDDKQYFHVGFTKDKFPHIFIGHQPNKMETFIGPFTDGTALKISLRLLRNIFPYCTCKQKHNIPCLNYHIGKCLGFCCLKDNPKRNRRTVEYQKNIKAIKNILSGKRTSLIKKFKSEMETYAKKEQFVKAINLRNKIEKLEEVFENAKVISNLKTKNSKQKDEEILRQLVKILQIKKPLTRIEGYDISNIQGTHAVGSMVVFENGQPNKNEYRKFKIRSKNTPDDTAMLSEMIQRRFGHPEWRFPDLILIDGGKGQLNAVLKTINNQQLSIPIIAITKNDKHLGHKIIMANKETPFSQLPISIKNLLLQIDSEAHRFAISYHRYLRKNIFKSLPIR